jgi:dolichyl-phosphate-mannose-protein mannosyltransferase
MSGVTRTDELRARLIGYQPTDRLWGWLGPGLIAALGGLLRFWRLDEPHQLVFDETYYVKQGWSMISYGVEMRTRLENAKADGLFTAGNPHVYSGDGDMVVHPPVGKWLIGAGEWLFGIDSSFGWRFAVAVLGTLSILVVGRAARRMFRSTLLGCLAATLIAFEGLHFVMSRTGILDMIVSFFALGGFAALLVDRDVSREVLARKVGALPYGIWPTTGPWLGLRPWRWVAGLSLGLCTSTKWSGLFFLAAFGLMTVWWDMGARRAAGVRRWGLGALLKDGPYAALAMVGTTLVVYVASWAGWFLSTKGYHRRWAELNPGQGVQWLPPVLRSWWKYHQDMYQFNTTLAVPHSYQSNPWGWMVQARPTAFFYEWPKKGTWGCEVDTCGRTVHTIGTISIWWVGIAALVVCLFAWLVRRDWRAGAIMAGIIGGYLPWFQYQARTIYSFYAVAFEPFVILAIVFVAGLIIGGRDASPERRRAGLMIVGGYVLVCLALFAFYYPIYTVGVIPWEQWNWRIWFPSWT